MLNYKDNKLYVPDLGSTTTVPIGGSFKQFYLDTIRSNLRDIGAQKGGRRGRHRRGLCQGYTKNGHKCQYKAKFGQYCGFHANYKGNKS